MVITFWTGGRFPLEHMFVLFQYSLLRPHRSTYQSNVYGRCPNKKSNWIRGCLPCLTLPYLTIMSWFISRKIIQAQVCLTLIEVSDNQLTPPNTHRTKPLIDNKQKYPKCCLLIFPLSRALPVSEWCTSPPFSSLTSFAFFFSSLLLLPPKLLHNYYTLPNSMRQPTFKPIRSYFISCTIDPSSEVCVGKQGKGGQGKSMPLMIWNGALDSPPYT